MRSESVSRLEQAPTRWLPLLMEAILPSVLFLLLMSVVTGILYPLAVTGVAQVIFPKQANGSLIEKDGVIVGSLLIGQPFGPSVALGESGELGAQQHADQAGYFYSRPSATSGMPYNGAASSGSNLGPLSPTLDQAITERATQQQQKQQQAMRSNDLAHDKLPPVDLVTTSASGLDPHISVAAALWQVPRIAQTRHIDEKILKTLIQKHTQERLFDVFGAPHVNVLQLNLALDDATASSVH